MIQKTKITITGKVKLLDAIKIQGILLNIVKYNYIIVNSLSVYPDLYIVIEIPSDDYKHIEIKINQDVSKHIWRILNEFVFILYYITNHIKI